MAALGPGFAAQGFERREASAAVVWQRPAGRAVQNAVIRRLPRAPGRVLRMLDDRARDSYLALGKQVTAAYAPDQDIWFRHRDERDLDAWFQLLPVLLPGVLGAARLRLG